MKVTYKEQLNTFEFILQLSVISLFSFAMVLMETSLQVGFVCSWEFGAQWLC